MSFEIQLNATSFKVEWLREQSYRGGKSYYYLKVGESKPTRVRKTDYLSRRYEDRPQWGSGQWSTLQEQKYITRLGR